MALIDEIRALRERALSDLDLAYNYYIDAQIAWRLVRAVADSGYKFTFRNTTTGALTSQADLSAKAATSQNNSLKLPSSNLLRSLRASFSICCAVG